MRHLPVLEYFSVFMIGGSAYCLLEEAFRGWTHWCMFLCGGLCFSLLYVISNHMREILVKKWIMGAAVITTVEFLFGLYFTVRLGWNIWDYSHFRIQLMGQICLLFSFVWFLLCIPGVLLCNVLRQKFLSTFQKNP